MDGKHPRRALARVANQLGPEDACLLPSEFRVGLPLLLFLLALPVLPKRICPASDGGRAQQWATTSKQRHR